MNIPSDVLKTMIKSTKLSPSDALESVGACREPLRWVADFADAQTAWDACERGDWMLWVLGRLSGPPGSDSRKKVVLAACECARLALAQYEIHYREDSRPRTAIETAERHARSEASIDEVRAASAAAYDAYAENASDDPHFAYAGAAAAGDAAISSCIPVNLPGSYGDVAIRVSRCSANESQRLAECADIVRKHFPKAPKIP